MKNFKNPIVVALDTNDSSLALKLAENLKDHVAGFKVGPRLTLRSDKKLLENLSQMGLLFFDHKFFDIPSTTVASVEAAAELGADWVTVHALNGPECLRELAILEEKIKKTNPNFKILVVTILTSFSAKTLPPVFQNLDIGENVKILVESAWSSGLTSFVCSSDEILKIKTKYKDAFIVVPGIRMPDDSKNDQSRTATPKTALQNGASALVIGRPIVEAKDPVTAAKKILESLK